MSGACSSFTPQNHIFYLVEMVRLERTTVVLQTTALPVKLQIHILIGGQCGSRTHYPSPLIAQQVLSR